MSGNMSILTNFVAKFGAVVDEELHVLVAAVLGDLRLDLASIGATDSLGVAGVVGATIGDQWNSPNIPSSFIPPNLPNDLEETGGDGVGVGACGHDVGEGHDGDGEDGLVEQHGDCDCEGMWLSKGLERSRSESRDFQRECRGA